MIHLVDQIEPTPEPIVLPAEDTNWVDLGNINYSIREIIYWKKGSKPGTTDYVILNTGEKLVKE